MRSALNKPGLFNGSDDTAAFHRWMKKEYPGFADDWGVLNAKQQAGFMQDYVDSTGASFPNIQNMSGEKDAGVKAYQSLQSKYGPQGLADYLKNNGVPGIRYLDGGSRSGGSGTSNFVAFDPELIRILERNGVATGNQPWKPGEWQGMLSGTK